MKFVFVTPPAFNRNLKPAERTAGCTRVVYPAPNIYELQVVAVLENAGLEVHYRDFVFNNESESAFVSYIAEYSDVAFFIWGVNLSKDDDLHAIKLIRNAHPDAKIVMMGPGPTFFSKDYLTDQGIIVLRGEPEETALEIAKQIASNDINLANVKGISYLDTNGNVQHNASRPLIQNLDALPFVARHHLNGKVYHNAKLKTGPYTTMITSRNCPYQCVYCVPSSLTFAREIEYRNEHHCKPKIGYRSVENVEAELKMLSEQGYRAIGFMDDNFIWKGNEARTLALCKALKKYGFVWGCQARVDAITEEIAKALGESGCGYVDFGIESFSPKILEYIKKGITPDQIEYAIKLLQKYNVPVKLNVLIGSSPYETKETIKETLHKAKSLHVDQVMFNIVSPFPGTEFYKVAKENGWLLNGEYRPTDVQRESILNYPHLSAKEMEKALYYNNLQFFLSPSFIARHLFKFTSWSDFFAAAKALKIKLFG